MKTLPIIPWRYILRDKTYCPEGFLYNHTVVSGCDCGELHPVGYFETENEARLASLSPELFSALNRLQIIASAHSNHPEVLKIANEAKQILDKFGKNDKEYLTYKKGQQNDQN